jgi:hypothetical protein
VIGDLNLVDDPDDAMRILDRSQHSISHDLITKASLQLDDAALHFEREIRGIDIWMIGEHLAQTFPDTIIARSVVAGTASLERFFLDVNACQRR